MVSGDSLSSEGPFSFPTGPPNVCVLEGYTYFSCLETAQCVSLCQTF